jgi:quercetin dioxygenase-like cupin family protein
MQRNQEPAFAPAVIGAIVVAVSASVAASASATSPSGFSAVQQWKGDYGPMMVKGEKTGAWDVKITTKSESDVYVTRNSIAAGGHSGWHMHPGPSLITVTVGEITVYDSSDPLCTPKVYRAGDGFIDSGDHAHLLKNESGAAAETVAVQFLADGSTRRIDVEPAPNNCSF